MSEIFTRLNDTIRKTKYLFFLMLASSALQAQTKWYVNDNSTSGDIYTTAIGNNANAGTSASAPAAFTAAAAGDIIYVDKGTFTGTGNKMFTFNKAITIIGAGTGNTIFTSHTDDRFATIAANNVSIQNLQLYDFFLASGNGQALLVNTNITGFKLTNVVMKKNYGSSSTGESIYLSSGSSSTFDGLFFSCSGFNGASGGAIKVNSCSLLVKNSAFSQSRDADGKGGAIEISGTTSVVTVDNTSFDGNSARAGGAIAQNQGKLYVTNSCFNRNYIQGDSGASNNGGGHYYAVSTDTNLIASFTNCKFQGAFFCATTNPTGYLCESSTNTSNDGAAFSLRGTSGTFTFDTCLFDNSNMPALNFDNGLDFYVQPSGAMLLTINNCKFANDLTNLSASKARNLFISGTLNNTTQKVIVTNSGASATANRDGITGNNFSLSGTLTTGSNSAVATSDATASCGATIAGCSISVNCATEANAPVITACAPNQTLSSCSGTLPDYRPLIAAFDDCDFTITQSPAPGTSLSSLGNGDHTITFTVSDQSPNSPNTTCTMVLSLSGCYTCNPSLSYPNTEVCSASAAVTPTFSPAGGTFTSASGLTIDATTGEIDPSASTAGTYTITYTPNASFPTCTTTSTFIINAAPAQPTIACYETATLNAATCSWDVTGTQPTQPTVACYETATFNTTTCEWDVTGTQPTQPTLACYESATFNTTTCEWDVTGTQPTQPTVACYETATFNTTTCEWDVTGTQPAQPTVACYETATFNTTTCEWDVTGTQPAQPTVACYETATFNTTTCEWDVTGTQPAQPTVACYQTATFNTTTCSWDVTGTQPAQPTVACYETATFNTTTCEWDVTGTQPAQPTLACYESATFNSTTCEWDVTGTELTATATAGTISCHGGSTDVTVVVNGGTEPYTISPSTTNLPAGPHQFTITDANGCETSASVVITEPDALIASITSSKGTNFCFGETSILTASEGTSYLWNTGATTASISVTTSGTYSVTVTNENGCEANTSLIVNANYCNFACPTIGNLLQNGSFENPSKNGYYGFEQMPFWTNAADGNKVEIMGANLYCVGCWTPPANGIQFIELNANQRGNIHQDVTVLPNKSLELSFMHRARESAVGAEKLRVTLSDPTNNSNVYTFDVTAVFGVWKKITGNYVTGPNQTSVRVRLQTITSLYPGSGNYLDNVMLNYVDCGPNTTTIIGSNYICDENDATLSVTNTTNAVSYLWSNGATTPSITVDQPGSYFVKVTFANGTNIISAPFVVADFLASAAINGTSSFCTGTTNTLTATGGSSYLWNTGATSASINVTTPGTYSVIISNSNGCSIEKQIIVSTYVCTYCPASNNLLVNGSFENPAITSSWGIVSVPSWTNLADNNKIEVHKNVLGIPVPNGSQYIEVNGSTYGKIYQDVTVLANKSLQLSFMYRGRSSYNESIKITLLDPTNNTNIYSFNATATHNVWKKITANYSSGVNQTKIRVLIEGLTGQSAGSGNLIDNVNLNYYDCANNSSVVIGFNEICNGSSTILSLLNNNNIVSYLWSNGATTPTISVNQAGNYSVTVTLNDGSSLTSSTFNVSTCNVIVNKTAVEKIEEKVINYNVILYPNPTVSSFSLNVVSDSLDTIEVSVYDIQGRNIENKTFSKEDINSISIGESLPTGIYNVIVKQGENIKSQRLIKK